MTRKQRRLMMIGGAGVVLVIAVGLVLNALRDSIVFFSTPKMVAEQHVAPGKRFRLGGVVEPGSVKRGDQLAVTFTIADGNPGRARGLNVIGMKRAEFSEEQIKSLNIAYRTLYRKGLNTTQAIETIRSRPMTTEVEQFVSFVESSQRGVISASRREAAD